MTARVVAAPLRRLLPRQEAALYCGVGLDVFDADWRPFLATVPKSLAGTDRNLLFDVRDLDALIDERKRPAQVKA